MIEHIITVFGKKGFGKTSWIWHFIMAQKNELILVYDHFDEYSFDEKIADYHDSINHFIKNPSEKMIHVFRGQILYDNFFQLGIALGNCILVFDEIDKCCSAQYVSEPLRNIIHYGRHIKNRIGKISSVRLITASRRPANVSRDLTSQSDRLIIFRIDEPRDVAYVSDYSNQAIADKIQNLDVLHYIEYPQSEKD